MARAQRRTRTAGSTDTTASKAPSKASKAPKDGPAPVALVATVNTDGTLDLSAYVQPNATLPWNWDDNVRDVESLHDSADVAEALLNEKRWLPEMPLHVELDSRNAVINVFKGNRRLFALLKMAQGADDAAETARLILATVPARVDRDLTPEQRRAARMDAAANKRLTRSETLRALSIRYPRSTDVPNERGLLIDNERFFEQLSSKGWTPPKGKTVGELGRIAMVDSKVSTYRNWTQKAKSFLALPTMLRQEVIALVAGGGRMPSYKAMDALRDAALATGKGERVTADDVTKAVDALRGDSKQDDDASPKEYGITAAKLKLTIGKLTEPYPAVAHFLRGLMHTPSDDQPAKALDLAARLSLALATRTDKPTPPPSR